MEQKYNYAGTHLCQVQQGWLALPDPCTHCSQQDAEAQLCTSPFIKLCVCVCVYMHAFKYAKS